jgi:actin-related protein 4
MTTPGYGGDEISAIVLDPGAYTTHIGYAGEDTPKANIPTFCGYYTVSGTRLQAANKNKVI